ncbi:MAG: hypothetical protein SFY32_00965 [Bacteroidota bacterium]|nr:hypothetical protein [Bacteroidota bacterium]
MKDSFFEVGKIIIWIIVIASNLTIFAGALTKIMHWGNTDTYFIVGLLLLLPIWVIVFIDVIIRPIHLKMIWVFSMLFFPVVVTIVYLVRRKKIILNIHN